MDAAGEASTDTFIIGTSGNLFVQIAEKHIKLKGG
jgi:hypothetical protein